MNHKDRELCFEAILREAHDIRNKKGMEYSGDEDLLSNFKRVAEITGATKYQVLLVYLSKHYDSICNAIKKNPDFPEDGSEPLDSRIADLINYLGLLKCLRDEDRPSSPFHIQTYTKEELGIEV